MTSLPPSKDGGVINFKSEYNCYGHNNPQTIYTVTQLNSELKMQYTPLS